MVRTFLRPVDGRVVAGVAAAVARWVGVDVCWVRGVGVVGLVAAACVDGWLAALVVAAYVVAALVIPAEGRPVVAPADGERRG